MIYTIHFTTHAVKSLSKVNEPYYSHVKRAIRALATNPRPQGYKKLKGINGYRIRVGSYRIIYDIFDKELIVDIITLGHRKDIY